MKLQEARQYVADFARGHYNPAEHAAFLRWVTDANTAEWKLIADEHEARYEQWLVFSKAPSPEWVVAMENRLDRVERKGKNAPAIRLPFGRRIRAAAASVLVLAVGAAVWYHSSEKSSRTQERQALLASLTQTTAVARGGAEQAITLPDGSRVWLNAASMLKYPAKFTGKERVVELSGEAYFDVTRQSEIPFRVLFRDAEVKVLGTHFNIMAYDNEPVSKATLIDGSISVEGGSQRVTLHPGEQGEIPYPSPGAIGPIRVIPGIDPTAVLAWRDGGLNFSEMPLHAVFRTLERVFDVDIQLAKDVRDPLINAAFSRSDGLAYILHQLEIREHLHIVNNGKKVTVTLAT
ncbi:MAG TPA: FecR domain-containing protein [Puia sp.]|nr:FecR domain-containing protein [Puia sp.]